jgi:predicted RNA-binding protein with PUA-like domain
MSARSKASPQRYWLLKSEAECFGFDDLWRAPKRRTAWDGVRNYQARNFLRDQMSVGDGVLFYHSNAEPSGVAGLARVASKAYPDPTQFDPSAEHFDPKSRREDPAWLQVDIEAWQRLPRFVPLAELKLDPRLAKMLVIQRGQRLSVMPVSAPEWRAVLALGGLAELHA